MYIKATSVDVDEVERHNFNRIPVTKKPLFVDSSKTRALAVMRPDKVAHLLEKNFGPLNLTNEQKRRVLESFC
jgi:hypothetical protein